VQRGVLTICVHVCTLCTCPPQHLPSAAEGCCGRQRGCVRMHGTLHLHIHIYIIERHGLMLGSDISWFFSFFLRVDAEALHPTHVQNRASYVRTVCA